MRPAANPPTKGTGRTDCAAASAPAAYSAVSPIKHRVLARPPKVMMKHGVRIRSHTMCKLVLCDFWGDVYAVLLEKGMIT